MALACSGDSNGLISATRESKNLPATLNALFTSSCLPTTASTTSWRKRKSSRADENRQCVKRIRVPGKHGPVELSAVIFSQDTIIPQGILPTLPKATFDVVPEERKAVVVVTGDSPKPTAAEETRG